LKLSKIRDVKLPTRGTSKSAGIDFYIPKFTKEFLESLFDKNKESYCKYNEEYITIPAQNRILIPSGIKVNIPEGYMLAAFNKSGISVKKGLDILACIIDEDYQGEIHLSLVNTTNDPVIIYENEKIVQFILVPVLYDNIEEVDISLLYDNITERADGGFGSTNKETL
jgi:dUTP pyrophosphatase